MHCARPDRAMLVITHYQRLLELHRAGPGACPVRGRVVRSGGPGLALELEETGYAEFDGQAA